MSHNIDDLLEEIEILKGYKHMHQKLNEQNKRYREAMEKAIDELNHGCKYHAHYVLEQRLEESE